MTIGITSAAKQLGFVTALLTGAVINQAAKDAPAQEKPNTGIPVSTLQVPKGYTTTINKDDGTKIVQEFDGTLFRMTTEKLIEKNKKVVGITGEDLFKEFLLNNRNSQLKILKRFSWEDNSFIYKKPALCLLGNKSKKFKELPKSLKICINSKYKELAKKYCINFFGLIFCKG